MGTELEPPLKIAKAAVVLYFLPLVKMVSFLHAQSKSLKAIYNRMGMAEKLGFWGSLASISGLLIIFLPGDGNSNERYIRQETFGNSSPNVMSEGDVNIKYGDRYQSPDVKHEGEGDVNINYGFTEKKYPPYNEPTEKEMKNALIRAMQMRGGKLKTPDTIVSENSIAGMGVEILELEKLGCQPAKSGAGYVCNYRQTSRIAAYSTEGTSAGDQHARGVNTILKFMMGGRDTVSEIAKSRFLKSDIGWIASNE